MRKLDFTLLYVGNMLQKHGKTPTSIDTLSPQLENICSVISVSNKKNIILRMLDILWVFFANRKQINGVLIDTYSSKNFYVALIMAYCSRLFRIDYYLYLHGGDLPARLKNNKKMSHFLFNHSKLNIVPSGYLKEAFEEAGYKVTFIPNNIDISRYPFKERTQLTPNILYVRAFSSIYNPQMAIRAFKHIKSKYPDAQMCMVGPDKDGTMQECIKLIKELQYEQCISLKGKLDKSEWIELSSGYDIFINPTNFDNQPVSIIEAMSLGFPIVSTNVGGLPYLIEDGIDGLLVDKNCAEQMSEAVIKLLENKPLANKLSVNARKKAMQFDWDNVQKLWEEVLERDSDAL